MQNIKIVLNDGSRIVGKSGTKNGHIDIINQGLRLFETIIIGIGVNKSKKHMFSVSERKDFIKSMFKIDPSLSFGFDALF